MTPDVIAALRLLVLPTVALVVIVVAAPGRLELAARIYALIVGVVALVGSLLSLAGVALLRRGHDR